MTEGTRGARYTLDRLHATGSLERVWVAKDATLEREVALKEIRPDREEEPGASARLLREARIAAGLEHPGVLPVYDLSRQSDTGRPFVVARFVHGRTLTEAAAEFHRRRRDAGFDPLELHALLSAFLTVAQAVALAHARGIVHLGLEGDGVVLGEFGEATILSWGFARRVDDAGRPEGHVAGAPGFMAPEQASGHLHEVGPRSDVHGLGALLHLILTGQPPFAGKDDAESMRRVIQEQPAPARSHWPDAPPPLEAICLKALAKDPAARYESATALIVDLRRFFTHAPRRRRTAVVVLAAVLGAIVVGLAAGAVWLDRQRRIAERETALVAEGERQARGAVEALIAALDAPGSHAGRRELLGAARSYYASYLEAHGSDPAARAEVAAANLRLGRIARESGDGAAAEASFRSAADALENLAREEPGTEAFRSGLVEAMQGLASIAAEGGRGQEVEAAYRRALGVVESVPGGAEGETAYLEAVSRMYADLGRLLADQRRTGDSVEAYRKALAWRERLSPSLRLESHLDLAAPLVAQGRDADAVPHLAAAAEIGESLSADDPEMARRLASTYAELGRAQVRLGHLEEGRNAHARALALREKLADPLELATSSLAVGELGVRAGDVQGAIAELDRAERTLDGLARASSEARALAAATAAWRARALDGLGKLAPADKAWQRALALNDRGDPTITAAYARALARRGKLDRALERARAVEDGEGLPGDALYDLAATYGIVAAHDAKRRDALAARAMRLLEQARDLGYFRTEAAVRAAAADPDLAPLGRLPGFEKLVQGVPSSP